MQSRWLNNFVQGTMAGWVLVCAGCGAGGATSPSASKATGPVAVAPATTANTETPSEPAASEPAVEPAAEPAAEPATNPPEQAEAPANSPTNQAAADSQPVANEPPVDPETVLADNAPANPFTRRIPVPDFPKDMQWLNVSGPLRKQDLRGKFVLLDFWTYCCINCMHILPELKKLERAYPNQLIVIGVHSAKFETEKGSKNIEEAILRYEIEHPVVNDADHQIWDIYGVQSWPSIVLVDPEGQAVWLRSGEFKFEEVDAILKEAIPYYRHQKTLDESPIRFELAAQKQPNTPLRFPGKVLADEAGGRLFIADSNHNRIVVTGLDGKLQQVIGSGQIGRKNGDFATSTFDHPQGMFLKGNILYVADTENHMLRKVDLAEKKVTTLAGTGVQGTGWPGIERIRAGGTLPLRWIGKPRETALNSPWDLWIHGGDLYIAMAGPHQIWKMPLDESSIGPYAGNSREDIVDGPLLPREPYQQGYSSFAQPSGLSSDGEWLYVADSEGSSVRAVPFDAKKEVRTVVGTSTLPRGRLFHFGDQDGNRSQVLLQHCLGVAYVDGKIYVADTYNNKIKVVDSKSGTTKTVAGTGKPGTADEPAEFDEPAGLSFAKGILYIADTNNHQIRTLDIASGKVSTLAIDGLRSPEKNEVASKPNLAGAAKVNLKAQSVSPQDGQVSLKVKLQLPKGWKMNPQAPMRYWLDGKGESGAIDRQAFGDKRVTPPAAEFTIPLPVKGAGEEQLEVSLVYYYCQDGAEGLCKVGGVVWTIPLQVEASGKPAEASLEHQVE